MNTLYLLVFFCLDLIRISYGSVYIGFPLNEQLPNVARVNEAYLFTMANTTYKADGEVSYSASNLPDWMSFDGGSRTFTGTPSKKDAGEFNITLTGTDSDDGSTLSNQYSMIVSEDEGIHLSSDDVMFTEIAKYGYTNGNDGLVVNEGDKFDIKFDSDIFKSSSNSSRPIVAYYGRSSDRSSLPNWIDFNSDDLSFSGTVPYVASENAPSFKYGFSFIASDYYGFAGAEGIFRLVVGGHQLSTSLNETIKLNGTLESEIEVDVPILSDVYLDGEAISTANISNVYAEDLPDYVTFNEDNFTLTGIFPDKSTFDNFTIIVEDKYGNSVDLPYLIDAIGSVFTVKDLKDVNATKGEYFSYELLKSLFTDYNNTKISVDYDADWLTYHKDNRTLSGKAPNNFNKVKVKVAASSDYDSETKSFNIDGISKKKSSSSSSRSSSSRASSSATSESTTSSSGTVAHNKSSGVDHKALAIGLGVGIPLFLIALAALILLFCCLKRRKNKKEDDFDQEKATTGAATGAAAGVAAGSGSPELTGPGFGTTVDLDDRDENAKQLAALNVLKLDEKDKLASDAHSTSSSITHVESEYSDDSRYFDASEKPLKSWRANDKSDIAKGGMIGAAGAGTGAVTGLALLSKDNNVRQSDASMSTVNTEQLFSVRLVDDNSYRNSNRSSYGSGQFLSNGSLNALLRREESGNIQKLDSDGNIVGTANGLLRGVSAHSRTPSSDLDILVEENSKDHSNDTNDTHTDATIIRTNDILGDDTASLNSRFQESRNTSGPTSYQQLVNQNNEHGDFADEFKATRNPNSEIKWVQSTSTDNLISPASDTFLANDANANTPKMGYDLQSSPIRGSNLSAISLGRSSSENPRISNASLSTKAKLVDFTRKSSMRESAHEPNIDLEGETAQIHYDDDSV